MRNMHQNYIELCEYCASHHNKHPKDLSVHLSCCSLFTMQSYVWPLTSVKQAIPAKHRTRRLLLVYYVCITLNLHHLLQIINGLFYSADQKQLSNILAENNMFSEVAPGEFYPLIIIYRTFVMKQFGSFAITCNFHDFVYMCVFDFVNVQKSLFFIFFSW